MCVSFVYVCAGEKHVTFSVEVAALLGPAWIIDSTVAGGSRWQEACCGLFCFRALVETAQTSTPLNQMHRLSLA